MFGYVNSMAEQAGVEETQKSTNIFVRAFLFNRRKSMGKSKKFSTEEIVGFSGQIAIVLRSGISLYEGIYMLEEEVQEEGTKEVLKQIEDCLNQSMSFYDALKQTKAFPDYFLQMVHIGEESGKLETVMDSLAKYYERENNIRHSIKSVISYPLTMFCMIGVIVFFLVGKILPMFEQVFRNLDVEIASSSAKIMQFGMLTGKALLVFCLLVLVVAAGLWFWYKTEKGNHALKQFCGTFFVTKKTMTLLAVGRFISSMSVMISSGMDSVEALKIAEGVIGQNSIKKKVENCIATMEKEESFAKAIQSENIVTGMQGRMLAVAEKSGRLEEVLVDVGRQYDEGIEEQLGSFCARMETSLVLALSLLVGGILISIMFPLVSIITSIG